MFTIQPKFGNHLECVAAVKKLVQLHEHHINVWLFCCRCPTPVLHSAEIAQIAANKVSVVRPSSVRCVCIRFLRTIFSIGSLNDYDTITIYFIFSSPHISVYVHFFVFFSPCACVSRPLNCNRAISDIRSHFVWTNIEQSNGHVGMWETDGCSRRVLMFIFIDACLLLKVQSVVIRFIVHTVHLACQRRSGECHQRKRYRNVNRVFLHTKWTDVSSFIRNTLRVFLCFLVFTFGPCTSTLSSWACFFFFSLSTFYRGLFNCCKRGIPTDYYRCRLYGSFIIQQRFVRCALVTTEWNTLNVGPRQWWRWLLLLVW